MAIRTCHQHLGRDARKLNRAGHRINATQCSSRNSRVETQEFVAQRVLYSVTTVSTTSSTYRDVGRGFRLTEIHGNVVHVIVT